MKDINYKKTFPLLPPQKWILKTIDPPHHWNISYMSFSEKEYNTTLLKNILEQLVDKHTAFKIRYIKEGNTFFQTLADEGSKKYHLAVFDLKNNKNYKTVMHKKMNELQESINIFNGPVLAVGQFITDPGNHLYFVVHHSVLDGYSFYMMMREIDNSYSRFLYQKIKVFQRNGHCLFKKAVEQLHRYSNSEKMHEERKYWQHIFKTSISSLPKDNNINPEERLEKNQADVFITLFSKDELSQLKQRLINLQINKYDFLLTGMARGICEWKKEDRIILNITHHGRDWSIGDLNIKKSMGPFWTTFPVLLNIPDNTAVQDQLSLTREQLNRVKNHGRGFEILKEIIMDDEHSLLQQNPSLNDFLFNYVGEMSELNVTFPVLGKISPLFKDFNRHKEARCYFAFVLNLREIDETLTLQISFNTLEFKKEKCTMLAEIIVKNLYLSCKELNIIY